ncbi:MAG: DNA double-strand break repair nuclease NurA, partial [Chloroflexi bacterium]|nr:DNA double-strand break repair nuclease NurA [Chloroflexota bacterium]
MPAFTDKFIAEIEAQRGHFHAVFSSDATSGLEERLAPRVAASWHELPFSPETSIAANGRVFAIDGSEATRNFSNASWLLICQGLLVGPDTEIPTLQVRLVPGNVANAVVDSYASRLMRWLELRLALDHIGRFAGGTLILDGSLYSTLPHLLYPLDGLRGQGGCSADADLPIRILEAYIDLLEACRRQDVLLLGISKTTQDRVLTHTLLHLPDDLDQISVDLAEQSRLESDERLPPDAEALIRWTEGPGFTTPVLLGMYSFGRYRETLLSEPGRIAESFEASSSYPPARLSAIVERLLNMPAIATFHVRFGHGDDCFRVDLPAHAIGRDDCLVDLSSGIGPV